MGGERCMKLDYEVNISTAKILRKYGLGEDKAAQRFLAEDVERKCRPYVPRQSGILEETARVTEDCIIYQGPYAHYQYMGEVRAGRAPKHLTGQPLTYQGAPMRGKQWDKRMMADHGKEVEKDLEGYLKGRGK